MQKKLIALAVAGLASTAAFAQTNVTIYGVVDAGYAYSTGDRQGAALNKSANFSGIQSGILAGSRIGFKGEEALGNGLKAVFTLEYGIANDQDGGIGTGTGALGTRQSFIGLSHAKLGTVLLGRQYAPGYMATTRNDALASSVPSALTQMNTAGANSIQGGSNARLNNAVAYVTPTWSGFTATAAYAFGESNTENATAAGNGLSTGNNGVFGLGLNYANGPLNLDLVYHSRQGVEGRPGSFAVNASTGAIARTAAAYGTGDSINEWFLGGSYDFGIVKVMATYQDQNDNNGTSATEIGNKVWSVGAVVPVFGNGKIHASYADISWDRRGAGDSNAWTLAYTHALSKRTTLYTGYTRASNDNDVVTAAGAVAATRAVGENNSTFVAGINHSF